MMKKRKPLFVLTFLFIFLSACTAVDQKSNDDIQIYTTVYPLQYFAERIGGEYVSVHSIYPPGSDEHSFDPTQKDMIDLANADLFFYIGLGLEGFVENAQKTLKNEHVQMIATADAITEDMFIDHHEEDDHDHDHGHHHGDVDPHVWISPILSDALAYSIKDALIKIAPDEKDYFEENFEDLRDDLLQLDRKYRDMALNAPSKTFFVSHAAFGYLADTYGLEQVAIAGLNSQSEPSQKELAALIDYAREKNVQYVLFEQNISSNLTKVIQNEINAEALTLHNLGVLTVEDIKNKEDYFSLMERNLTVLEKVFQAK